MTIALLQKKVLKFLELFYNSTVALSGVYYPTSPLMLHYLVRIAIHLKNYANDTLLSHTSSVECRMIYDPFNCFFFQKPWLLVK
jgi:hypothetical protein